MLFDLKEEVWGEGGGEELRREGEEQEAEYDIDELDARLVSYAHALKHQSFAPHPEDYDLSKVARYQEFLGHVCSSAVCQVMSNKCHFALVVRGSVVALAYVISYTSNLLLYINCGLVYNFMCMLERTFALDYKVL